MNYSWKQKITAIWVGQSISLMSSSILQMAIIWYITEKTGSAMILTFSTLSAFLPQALLGAFAGVYIDRYPKKNILIFADLTLAIVSLFLAVYTFTNELPIWLILVSLAIRSIGTTFHEPAAQSLVPLIVPDENLTQFAGYSQAFDSICTLMSPALASILFAAVGLEFILVLDAVGAFIAISILFVIKFEEKKKDIYINKPINLIEETKTGIKVLKNIDGVMPLMILGTLYCIIYSPVGSLYPHMTMVYFGGTTTQSGFVEMIFSLGTVIGAMILGKVANKLPKVLGMFGSIFLYGLGILIISLLSPSGYWIFVVISFFVGTTIPFYHGINRAIYQLTIPNEYLGRAFAIAQSLRRLGMPIGLLFGGIFADTVGINVLYTIGGISAMILAVILTQVSALKKIRHL